MFSAGDKIVTRLVWRGTHTSSYGGVEATGKPTQVRDFAVWRFEDDKVAENSTIQDQFLLLKRIGYLPEDVYAEGVLAGRGRRAPEVVRTCAGGAAGPLLTSSVVSVCRLGGPGAGSYVPLPRYQ
jgi:hypothetical protein